jgi:hypothetical protein
VVGERGPACRNGDVDPMAQSQVAEALDLSPGCCNGYVSSVDVAIVTPSRIARGSEQTPLHS